jgi:hypothetical protein
MKKQHGMSALKLILIIALGILMASFIGCVGSILFTGAAIKGAAEAFNQNKTITAAPVLKQNQTVIPKPAYIDENQRRAIENQRKLDQFAQEQRQIQMNRPMDEPTQGYVEMNGKRIIITKSKPIQIQELSRQDVIDYKTKKLNER